jgi:hypothetical protein
MSASKAGPAGKVRRAEACNRARFPGFQALTQEKGGRNIGVFASPAPNCYFLPSKQSAESPAKNSSYLALRLSNTKIKPRSRVF